ncbi:MAG: MoaD/ThiS family protein [Verrucomicrobiota bacterium]
MIQIKVLLFSVLRDLAETDEISLELAESQTCIADAIQTIYSRYPEIQKWDSKLLVALNGAYTDRGSDLSDGDELALMPPVQGG